MKIYHLDHGAGFGGAERSLLELATSQRDLGHEPIVVSGRDGALVDAASAAGLAAHALGWPTTYVDVPQRGSVGSVAAAMPGYLAAVRSLRSDLRTRRPDVLHVHTRKAQLVAAVAARGLRPARIWHLRDDLPRRRIVRVATRLGIRQADHAVAISRWMVEDYRRFGALPRSGRIGLVPSGVRMSGLHGLPTPWLSGDRRPVVGYVGQIARRKGPDLLVGAATLLADLDGVSFIILGDVAFPTAEGEFGEELRAMIDAAGAAARIRWMPATTEPEVAFAAIDVLVVPNREPEPLGRVIIEAMASHRPIVGVATGATTELLDSSSAVLVPEATASALADGIRSVLRDLEGARMRAEAAALRVDAFEPVTVARRMDEEYEVARS